MLAREALHHPHRARRERPRLPRLRFWHRAVAVVGVSMWLLTIVPADVGIFDLIVFIPPAAALGVFMRWLSCAFAPSRWTWQVGLRAALIGALLLPPLLASMVALVGGQSPSQLLTLFVLGAWIALGVGLVAASVNFSHKGAHHGREG